MAVDGGGNAYVVGSTDRSLSGSNDSSTDMFVRKYSPGGSVLWTRQVNFSAEDYANAVAVSGSNVYLGVSYVSGGSNPGDGEYSVRIIKFSTGGVRAQGWGFVYDSVGSDYVEDLSTDSGGNIYFSGSTQSPVTKDAPSNFDGMVVKLNPSGTRVWSKRIASSGNESTAAVLARTPSEVYGAGSTSGVLGEANRGNNDAHLRRLSGTNGATVWTDQ